MSNAGDSKIDSAMACDVCFEDGDEVFTYLRKCVSLALQRTWYGSPTCARHMLVLVQSQSP